jgi:hypothetical protein
MLDLQHQYNNCTTISHMRVGPIHCGPPSCEGLLCSCCDGIVQESNPDKQTGMHELDCKISCFVGICADIALSKHEHWSSLAPLPFEVVISAGQKAKEVSLHRG